MRIHYRRARLHRRSCWARHGPVLHVRDYRGRRRAVLPLQPDQHPHDRHPHGADALGGWDWADGRYWTDRAEWWTDGTYWPDWIDGSYRADGSYWRDGIDGSDGRYRSHGPRLRSRRRSHLRHQLCLHRYQL